jgi:FAD/FMN-containing dehydrogenase
MFVCPICLFFGKIATDAIAAIGVDRRGIQADQERNCIMGNLETAQSLPLDGFTGEILMPGAAGFDEARAVWNAMIDRRPAIITRCRTTDDVIAAVNHARASDLPISIRAGGHNVAGHAVCDDGLMIDLSLMRAVTVDAVRRIASVEGGALWRDVDAASQAHGLATPGGLISDTGVAGLTLSGGIGWLRARHGLSIDNLVAADVVTAEGKLVHTDADENPDLLWALKGGGGNFGVVVRFEFALHPIGPEVTFAAPIYAVEDGPGPIRAWRDFLARHGGLVGSLCEFSTAGGEDFPEESRGKRVYTLACVYNGDAAEGETLLQPLRELGGMVTDFSARMDYCDLQQLFDTLMPHGEYRCYWKARYLTELSDDMIDLAMKNALAAPSDVSISSLWNFGGATAEVAAEATAFGDRSMGWMYSLDGGWSDAKDDAANMAWSRDGWESAEPYGHYGRAYLNFPGHGEDGEALTRVSFGANYQRLVEVKTKYDPDNRFRFNQNVQPET